MSAAEQSDGSAESTSAHERSASSSPRTAHSRPHQSHRRGEGCEAQLSPRDRPLPPPSSPHGHLTGTDSRAGEWSAEMAARERKRRLTDSADDSERRRTYNGELPVRDAIGQATNSSAGPSNYVAASHRSFDPVRNAFVTHEPFLERRPIFEEADYQQRIDGTGRRDLVLPRWQPDAEVTKCPICGTHFTWYFRKHHCRKCGRVVCASCSPHRITIPRQFIVHPPPTHRRASTVGQSSSIPPLQDLTEPAEASDSRHAEDDDQRPGSSHHSNPGLGGGQEVRLCNPCVPDPQPDREWQGTQEPDSYHRHIPYPREEQTTAWLAEQARMESSRRDLAFRRERGHAGTPEEASRSGNQFHSGLTAPTSDREYQAHRFANASDFDPRRPPPSYNHDTVRSGQDASISSHQQGPYRSGFRNSMPTPASFGVMRRPPGMPSPGGISHGPSRQRADTGGNRPRNQPPPGGPPFPTGPPFRVPPPQQRPRLTERDICPICRQVLPPIGQDGDESGREQHIMNCIASRDPSYVSTSTPPGTHQTASEAHFPHPGRPVSLPPLPRPPFSSGSPSNRENTSSPSSNQSPHLRHPPPPIYVVRFIATEKDCTVPISSSQELAHPRSQNNPETSTSSTSNGPPKSPKTQECTICMVEYEVGDKLARLECLCKFHEECIQSWFRRKRECPVHKRDEREGIPI